MRNFNSDRNYSYVEYMNFHLEQAVSLFNNKIAEDTVLFQYISEKILGQPVAWDGVTVERLLISMQSKETPSLIPGDFRGLEIDEKGHRAIDFLKSYFRCLLELYVTYHKKGKYELSEIVKKELFSLEFLIFNIHHRELCCKKRNLREHIDYMRNLLELLIESTKGVLIPYHVGIPGHTFYLIYFAYDNRLYAFFHNLGEGLLDESVGEEEDLPRIFPTLHRIDNLEEHLELVIKIRESKKLAKEPLVSTIWLRNDYIDMLYKTTVFIGALKEEIFSEFMQSTKNCVTKSYFFMKKTKILIEQGLKEDYGKKIFNRIYLDSINILHHHKARLEKGQGSIDVPTTIQHLTEKMASFSSSEDKQSMRFTLRGRSRDIMYSTSASSGTTSDQARRYELKKELSSTIGLVSKEIALKSMELLSSCVNEKGSTWKKRLIYKNAITRGLLIGEFAYLNLSKGAIDYVDRVEKNQEDQEVIFYDDDEEEETGLGYSEHNSKFFPQSHFEILTQSSIVKTYHSLGLHHSL